jgi:hypothetical protein
MNLFRNFLGPVSLTLIVVWIIYSYHKQRQDKTRGDVITANSPLGERESIKFVRTFLVKGRTYDEIVAIYGEPTRVKKTDSDRGLVWDFYFNFPLRPSASPDRLFEERALSGFVATFDGNMTMTGWGPLMSLSAAAREEFINARREGRAPKLSNPESVVGGEIYRGVVFGREELNEGTAVMDEGGQNESKQNVMIPGK